MVPVLECSDLHEIVVNTIANVIVMDMNLFIFGAFFLFLILFYLMHLLK